MAVNIKQVSLAVCLFATVNTRASDGINAAQADLIRATMAAQQAEQEKFERERQESYEAVKKQEQAKAAQKRAEYEARTAQQIAEIANMEREAAQYYKPGEATTSFVALDDFHTAACHVKLEPYASGNEVGVRAVPQNKKVRGMDFKFNDWRDSNKPLSEKQKRYAQEVCLIDYLNSKRPKSTEEQK